MSTIRIVICPHCNRGNTIYWVSPPVRTAYCRCGACGQLVTEPEKAHEYVRTTVSYYKIDYDVVDKIVRTYFDGNYSFVERQECGNDTCHEFNVTGQFDMWEQKDADKFRAGEANFYLSNHLILNVLCADRFLDPGKYIVEVCW